MVLRLLEQQLRAWKLSVQSEQGFLEERCAGVEETIKALRRETTCLQGLLTQVTSDLLTQGPGGVGLIVRHHGSWSLVCHFSF